MWFLPAEAKAADSPTGSQIEKGGGRRTVHHDEAKAHRLKWYLALDTLEKNPKSQQIHTEAPAGSETRLTSFFIGLLMSLYDRINP